MSPEYLADIIEDVPRLDIKAIEQQRKSYERASIDERKEPRILYKKFCDVMRKLADRRYPLADLYKRFQPETPKDVESRLKIVNG